MARYNILNKELYKAEVREAMDFIQSILTSLEKYCGRPDSQLLQDYQQVLQDDVAILYATTPELKVLSELKQQSLDMLTNVILGLKTPQSAKVFFTRMLERLQAKLEKYEADCKYAEIQQSELLHNCWSQNRGSQKVVNAK